MSHHIIPRGYTKIYIQFLEVTCRLIVSSLIISVSEKNENIYVIFIMTMADDESDKDGSRKKLQFYNARPINR